MHNTKFAPCGDGNLQHCQELEDKVKLPVLTTQSGTVYVLDPFGRDARVLSADSMSKMRMPNSVSSQKQYPLLIRLFVRYPEVPAKAVVTAFKLLATYANKPKYVYVTIEMGTIPVDWQRIQKFASVILESLVKTGIAVELTFEGVFSRPDSQIMDWIAMRKIGVRFALGGALGYPADLKSDTAEAIITMSEYGLRVPVLFYWYCESSAALKRVLKKALRLNKMAGVGVLPYFLSPRFDCKVGVISDDMKSFSKVLAFLHTDRLLAEFLEEPISEIEQQLMGSPQPPSLNALITESGNLSGFRRFPFAASGNLQLKTEMYYCCRGCAWKQICGGVDRSIAPFRQQHKIIAEVWCGYRKTLMRQIIGECLEIREHIDSIRENLIKDAS